MMKELDKWMDNADDIGGTVVTAMKKIASFILDNFVSKAKDKISELISLNPCRIPNQRAIMRLCQAIQPISRQRQQEPSQPPAATDVAGSILAAGAAPIATGEKLDAIIQRNKEILQPLPTLRFSKRTTSYGNIYVLSNSQFKDMCFKIGFTTNTPQYRSR
jgi:hypothetical protein